jgi:hypothetical protein
MKKFILAAAVVVFGLIAGPAAAHPSYSDAAYSGWYTIDNVAATHYPNHANVKVTWGSAHRTGSLGDYRVVKGKFDSAVSRTIVTRCVKVWVYGTLQTRWDWLGCWNLNPAATTASYELPRPYRR